jgi:DNA sulfur modification protein DndD
VFTIHRIEIDNFACFDNIVIEPSSDPGKPLTVIRAENGCGKTTLLRAIRWGMYGELSLPGNREQFSVHPADWYPEDSGVITTVKIEFETDGSGRDDPQGNPTTILYELTRSVTTISHSGAPDFRRINERTQLMVRDTDGSWHSHDSGVDAVVGQLLPWELRDFFVMDADEAADFVGGSENKMITRQEVTKKTTDAVRALLGIDIFRDARNRVKKLAQKFERQATKAVGDADLDKQQDELDELRRQQERLQNGINDDKRRESDIKESLDKARDSLELLVGAISARNELKHRLKDNRKRLDQVNTDRKVAIKQYAGELESIDLFGVLASREVAQSRRCLQPLYDNDQIPMKHIGFVRNLLRNGICVCGEDLSRNGGRRRHVEEALEQSDGQEGRANHLAQVLDAAVALQVHHDSMEWGLRCDKHAESISDIDEQLRDIKNDRRDIENKLDKVDDEQVQVMRDKIAALETQLDAIKRKVNTDKGTDDQLTHRITGLERQITHQRRRQRAARDQEKSRETADAVVEVLRRAYDTIEREQIEELSAEMNVLFANMVMNVADDESETLDHRKARLKMIDEVGLRPIHGNPGQFEIFALSHRGRAMPPTEINGASRRTIALAFVLALCKVSQTRAPLIADSLLNFMSGVVRSNTLRVTATSATQPILLLTGSDLESQTEVETVERFASATYTLTGQWQHVDHDGDVVNQTDPRRIALLCRCGPRQYCAVCERQGQVDLPGWSSAEGES